jgi:hypothetical protein
VYPFDPEVDGYDDDVDVERVSNAMAGGIPL